MAKNIIEKYIGKTYNYLTIIKILEVVGRNRYVLCKCKCGNIKRVRLQHLKEGNVMSCGCMYKEKIVLIEGNFIPSNFEIIDKYK